ncbi:MAG: hypothetical protein K0Q55_2010 [Verrucomicrobia bacterium]|jgi:hypothetical protein|nr:hypothetical protein [Verrucomicrobiota bacterium]
MSQHDQKAHPAALEQAKTNLHPLLPSQIRSRLFCYLPMCIFAGAIYWVLGSGLLILLLRVALPRSIAFWLGIILAAILTTCGMIYYARRVVHRLSQFRIMLNEDTLFIRAQTFHGLSEHHFPLAQIAEVQFGEGLNQSEKLIKWMNGGPKTACNSISEDVKRGRLYIRSKNGPSVVFSILDMAFPSQSLAVLAATLEKMNIPVKRIY